MKIFVILVVMNIGIMLQKILPYDSSNSSILELSVEKEEKEDIITNKDLQKRYYDN
jgi:hypothetical protein